MSRLITVFCRSNLLRRNEEFTLMSYRGISASKVLNSKNKDTSPLTGIRILDLTRIVAGPFCTMTLGDLGADVIKIERPGSGDEARKWGPPFIANSSESCYFISLNRNKKSVCIDLKSKEGQKIVHDLASKCDVLIENYVPGKLRKLGLSYEDLKMKAPHLIYCSLTGYGPHGPYAKRPGYDVIAASVGGLLHITGPYAGEPCKVGVAMVDLATGLYAHGAILAALFQRTRTGKGQKIDCDLLSTQVACLINIGSNYLNANREAQRRGTAHESIVPYQSFPTSDGGYFTVGAGSDQQFVGLCEKLGVKELATDARFRTNQLRVQNREILIHILRERFMKKTLKEWLDVMENSPFPYGPVNSMAQEVHTVRLRLRKPKPKKKVQWRAGTVDNEHMNKKKSKCCCQYRKPLAFNESSSSDEGECENCQGHVELKKKRKKNDSEVPPENTNPPEIPAAN